MSAAANLVAVLRKRREKAVDLGDGRSVTIRRPTEGEMREVLGEARTNHVAVVSKHVVDWSGFSEVTFLGAAVGSSDPVPFDTDLWSEFIADNNNLALLVMKAITDSINAHITERQADAKN